jgi:hypothetical protein
MFGERIGTTPFRKFCKQPSLRLRYSAGVKVIKPKSGDFGLRNRKRLVKVIALYTFECLFGKDVMPSTWTTIGLNHTAIMHQRPERPNAVDVLRRFQVVKEAVMFDGRDGDDVLKAVGGVDRFAGAELADLDKLLAVFRPVRVVVGDAREFDLVFELQMDDFAVLVGPVLERASNDGASARFDFGARTEVSDFGVADGAPIAETLIC